VVAPLSVVVVRSVIPYEPRTSAADAIAGAAAHPGAALPVLAGGIIAAVAWLIAVVTLHRFLVREAPLLANVGGVLALVGWSMIPMLVTMDVLIVSLARHGGANGASLLAVVQSSAAVGEMTMLFAAGHVIGMVILGIAVARSHRVLSWAGAAIVVGSVAHVLAAFGLSNNLLDGIANAVLAVGTFAVARATLAMDDDEWDIRPVPAVALPI
jgi:hypothetical protein